MKTLLATLWVKIVVKMRGRKQSFRSAIKRTCPWLLACE
nr:MAG TPA: hypothetical protein [Caudoviricetes sp.]